jgi:hypothetical protein
MRLGGARARCAWRSASSERLLLAARFSTHAPMKKKTAAKKTKTAKKNAAKKSKSAPKRAAAKKTSSPAAPSGGDVAKQIEQRFRDIGGWRGQTLQRMRALIHEADPDIVEERKWIKPSNPFGVPTYSHAGLVLTLEVYKEYVKVTFAYGSKVPDPAGIFNASLLGLRRAVDIREGETVDAEAFKALVKTAVANNVAKKS